ALLLILLLSAVAWASLVRPLREMAGAQRRLAGVGGRGIGGRGDESQEPKEGVETPGRGLKERQAARHGLLRRYHVGEYLGTGAMGTVFRGWDPKLQRPVALKTVRLGKDVASETRRDLLQTLLHEAVTVARISHGNVVSIYDVQDAPEGAFIAMEYVAG